MLSKSINWDDVRFFLSIHANASIGAAARALGVNHSTVLRRIDALERGLGQRLFDRLPSGYVLTEEGHRLIGSLDGVENHIESALRELSGSDRAAQGLVRLTSTDPLIHALLMPILAEFGQLQPRVQVELVYNDGYLNLTQREADIAVRGTNQPPPHLIGRPVGIIQTALYASQAYLRRPNLDDGAHRWVALEERLAHLQSAKWVSKHVDAAQIAIRVGSLIGMVDAVAAGIGVGWLLCPLADARPGLTRIRPPMPELDTQIWVLTHPSLVRVPKVQVLSEHLYQRLSADPRLLHERPGRH